MADIARDGNQIVLKLSVGERIMAVHRNVRLIQQLPDGPDACGLRGQLGVR